MSAHVHIRVGKRDADCTECSVSEAEARWLACDGKKCYCHDPSICADCGCTHGEERDMSETADQLRANQVRADVRRAIFDLGKDAAKEGIPLEEAKSALSGWDIKENIKRLLRDEAQDAYLVGMSREDAQAAVEDGFESAE